MIHMNAVRKALESMYKDTCTIYENQKIKDPNTHVTNFKEVEVLKDIKCRLSFSNVTNAEKGDVVTIAQVTKLFIAPEINIKAGSKLVITHEGVTTEYTRSGVPAIHSNHQEVVIELFKEYA